MEWVPVLSALATQPTYPTYPLYCTLTLKVHKYFSLLISLYIYKNSWNWLTRPRLRGWPQLAKIRQTSQWSKDFEISITVLQQTVQKSRQIEAGKNWTGFFLLFFVMCLVEPSDGDDRRTALHRAAEAPLRLLCWAEAAGGFPLAVRRTVYTVAGYSKFCPKIWGIFKFVC